MLHTPDAPAKGVLILFGGLTGEGYFAGSGSDISSSNNFLARTSAEFVTVKGGVAGGGYYASRGNKKAGGVGTNPCRSLSHHDSLGLTSMLLT